MSIRQKLQETVASRIDLIRSRAKLLNKKDTLLINMYLDNGTTFRQMARLAGVNEATISRRLHKIIQRLLDAHYLTVLRHSGDFTLLQLEIVQDYFLKGSPQRTIATERNCSRYEVRKTLLQVEKLSFSEAD